MRLIDADDLITRLNKSKKSICGLYTSSTPILEMPSNKLAYNDGIETAITEICNQPTVNDWIPVKLREATDEEKEEMADFYDCDKEDIAAIFDCKLPDDGQEVLISTKYGNVEKTTFYNDNCGCYFEEYEDDDDVLAWMPLPEPFIKDNKN